MESEYPMVIAGERADCWQVQTAARQYLVGPERLEQWEHGSHPKALPPVAPSPSAPSASHAGLVALRRTLVETPRARPYLGSLA